MIKTHKEISPETVVSKSDNKLGGVTTYIYRITTIIKILWLRLSLRSHICRTWTLARHLSPGSSMVSAPHRSSEGCGFDPSRAQKSFF